MVHNAVCVVSPSGSGILGYRIPRIYPVIGIETNNEGEEQQSLRIEGVPTTAQPIDKVTPKSGVMNGIDAARALKTLMPTVPVIVFSEYSDVFSEKEAPSDSAGLGACAYS
jgi:DNA-binding NarL/FixJ family response regulator